MRRPLPLLCFLCLSCASTPPTPEPVVHAATPVKPAALDNPPPKPFRDVEGEVRLKAPVQYTFSGENAEAYWSFSGAELSMQSKLRDWGCDRILRMDAKTGALAQVSSGKGATTCAFFLPGDQEIIYASTHAAGDACPPKPDMSQGYVWALYDSYDIYKANRDGSNVQALTTEKGYDAEATVCAKDGSIVFTSTRDGDIELYRMNKDGKNVKRLTRTPGYDGGAFFSKDCSKIVWRASRPRPGMELEDFQRLLGMGLVRPSKLELYVANADGSDATQVTYLDAASFAPFFNPAGTRVLFSTNFGDAKGREFDIWAVDTTGANLERITRAPGFDGFPMFSPDGTQLAFSSNRATEPGKHDTNLFIAGWNAAARGETTPLPADRVLADVRFLSASEREGRGIGTRGLQAAAAFVEQRMTELGLAPAGEKGTFRQKFPVVTELKVAEGTTVKLGEVTAAADGFVPMGFSSDADVKGDVVFVGYGIRAKELGVDDYAGVNVRGRIVVARRFTPEDAPFTKEEDKRRYGDLRHKAWTAREAGAEALVVVDWPVQVSPEQAAEARLPKLRPDGDNPAGIPVVVIKREAFQPVLDALLAKKAVKGRVSVKLTRISTDAYNIVGKIPASSPEARALPKGAVVVGAHYDHLGFGGHYSLAPDSTEAHVGADDNASGVAGILEAARTLMGQRTRLRRDVYVVAFAGEELGVLGSTAFTRAPPMGVQMKDVVAMLNLDMVGRLRENRLTVLGVESGAEWKALLEPACEKARVQCEGSGDGYGPSDHTPFYTAKVPVLHFFTGAHGDYHKPSDVAERINAAGLGQIASIVAEVAASASHNDAVVTYRNVPSPVPAGDLRSFNASLGTIPDYAPPSGTKGVLLAGVRAGGAAEMAGMQRGDVLIKLGTHVVGSVQDLMFVLNASKPGETVTATVLREGREVKMPVTFQESKRR